VDFNVPLDEDRGITDDARIQGALPTLKELREKGASGLVLLAHLGRPKGRDEKFSLKPVADRLGELLGVDVTLAPDLDDVPAGEVVMVENVRFFEGETSNDAALAERYAALADVYVNDAFGAAHRAHASTAGVVDHCMEAVAGFLMADEVEYLGRALGHPDRPFVAILGGAKVSDKLKVIENLLLHVDALLIGGAMAYTFLKAKGVAVGKSRVEDDLIQTAAALLERAAAGRIAIELPGDHVVSAKIDATAATETLDVGDAAIGDRMGLDIGPKTVARYTERIGQAMTIVWNGPMGVFELAPFAAGTTSIAHAVARVRGTTIIGGGDSVAAVTQAGVTDRITHISTGGGASLEFLGGRTLPGIDALERFARGRA
jgi:phosphoglycerate kinase